MKKTGNIFMLCSAFFLVSYLVGYLIEDYLPEKYQNGLAFLLIGSMLLLALGLIVLLIIFLYEEFTNRYDEL